MNTFDELALTLAVFLPLVGVVIIGLIPKANEELHKIVALATALVTLAVGVGILLRFDGEPLQSPGDLQDRLGRATPGHQSLVTVLRGGRLEDVGVMVGERPQA